MRDNSSKAQEHHSISMEEQQREASHDGTGRIRKYLDLAEKMFDTDSEDSV